jgi:hypothetical protein
MPPEKRQRDLSFREQEIGHILSRINTIGESCSVVGVGSVGKTNLLQHLREGETQYYHLREDSRLLNLVLIDPNNMLDSLPLLTGGTSPWAGYEIMMHRLYKEYYPFAGFNEEQARMIKAAYDQLRNGENRLLPHIGLRYLELALEQILGSHVEHGRDRKIAFIFDEFEEMLANLPPKFFQTMRGIRDDYKYQLTFVTFSRKPMPQLIEENGYDALLLEPFVELFTDSTIYLGPYSDNDAMAMLDRLTVRKHIKPFPPSFRKFLLRVTAGHAGMLRASVGLATQIPVGTAEQDALRFLANSLEIQAECLTVWDSLTHAEKDMLRQIAQDPVINSPDLVLSLLEQKHLLKVVDNRADINPPLFREFVRQNAMDA